MDKLIERFNEIDFGSDDSVFDFIQETKDTDIDVFTGTNIAGETIVLNLGKTGFKVSTYQNNGWIRVNEYTISRDENDIPALTRTETYEK